MDANLESQIRRYAAGDLAWKDMRDKGVSYQEVLAGLGELGLRPPVASLDGPNGENLRRGLTALRGALRAQADYSG